MLTTLDKVKIGQECNISRIDIKDKKRKRHLLDMGVTKGTKIKVKRRAPMGDPLSIEIRGYILCISKIDLKDIWVTY